MQIEFTFIHQVAPTNKLLQIKHAHQNVKTFDSEISIIHIKRIIIDKLLVVAEEMQAA